MAFTLIMAVVSAMVYVRFAPSDIARWHIDPAHSAFKLPRRWVGFCPDPDTRFAGPSNLAALDAVIMATPHTTRLAGSVAEGRITWVTRTAIFGFPDYTTASQRTVDGVMYDCIVARQRFGLRDFGVNTARLTGWLQQTYGYTEAPDLVWHR